MQMHLITRPHITNNPKEGNPDETVLFARCLFAFPHIALLEAGLPYDLVKVDLKAKKLEERRRLPEGKSEGASAGARPR